MKILKVLFISIILNMNLFSMSIYHIEVRDLLSKIKEERMQREAKEKMLACNEISAESVKSNETAMSVDTQKMNTCLESKE